MRKYRKQIAILLLTVLFITMPFLTAAQFSGVRIFIDGAEVSLGVNKAYYDTVYKSVMTPLRGLCELLNAEMSFDGDTGLISVTKGSTVITMTLNDKVAKINSNRQEELTAPPVILDGISYVPLDFMAEALQYDYFFNQNGMYVSLKSRISYDFGVSLERIRLIFGEQTRIDKSEKGYDWYVFNNDYQNYTLVGIEEGLTVAYFVSGTAWSINCGIFNGMKLSSCESLMSLIGYTSKNNGNKQIYTLNDEVITAFYDDQEAIYAVLYEQASYINRFSVDTMVTASHTLELGDLINCYRKIHNCSALPLDNLLSSIAKNHSLSMAGGDYFDHTDQDGRDYIDRMTEAGYGDCYISEIIAEAYNNSFNAFSAFITDESYRSIVLANYDSIGCGTAYNADSAGLLYYTQIFYAVKD